MCLSEYFQILIFWLLPNNHSARTKPVYSRLLIPSRRRDWSQLSCLQPFCACVPSPRSRQERLRASGRHSASCSLHASFLGLRIKDSLKFLQKDLRQLPESSLSIVSPQEPPGRLLTLFSPLSVCLLCPHLCGWAAP